MTIIRKILQRICFYITYKQLAVKHKQVMKENLKMIKELHESLSLYSSKEDSGIAKLMSEALITLWEKYDEITFYSCLEKIENLVRNLTHSSSNIESKKDSFVKDDDNNLLVLKLADISKNTFSYKLAELGYIYYLKNINSEAHANEYLHCCMSLVDIYQFETNFESCIETLEHARQVAKDLNNFPYQLICLARMLAFKTFLKTDPLVNVDYSFDFLYSDIAQICNNSREENLIEKLDSLILYLYGEYKIDNCLLMHILTAKHELEVAVCTNADMLEGFNEEIYVNLVENATQTTPNLSYEEINVLENQDIGNEALVKILLNQFGIEQVKLNKYGKSDILHNLVNKINQLSKISHSPFIELLSHYICATWYYGDKNDIDNYEKELKAAIEILDKKHRLADVHSFLTYIYSLMLQLVDFMDNNKVEKLEIINSLISKIHRNNLASRSWYIKLLLEKIECYEELCSERMLVVKEIFHEAINDIQKRFFYMTNNQRAQLLSVWQSETNSLIGQDNTLIITEEYNLLSLEKGILMTTSREIRNILLSSQDNIHLIELLDNFDNKERQLKNIANISSKNIAQLRMESLKLNTELMKLGNQGLASILDFELVRLQSILNDNEVVVDIYSYDKDNNDIHYFAYVITNNQVRRVDICNESDLIKISSNTSKEPWMLYENSALGHTFYSLIWKNLFLDNQKILYISPTGSLLKIAIENLVVDEEGTTLSECFKDVIRISHPRYIKNLKEDEYIDFVDCKKALFGNINYGNISDDESVTLGYGFTQIEDKINDLKPWGSLKKNNECNNVSQLFKISAKTKKEDFIALDNSIQILHVMTHGFFFNIGQVKHLDKFSNAADVMDTSGIIFEGGNKDWISNDDNWNGILRSSELAHLNLTNIDLAVFSVCDSANGLVDRDGLMGLQRALKLAGVKTIVHSLWEVDVDMSSRFSFTFYRNLMKGMTKRDAFKHAVNRIKNDTVDIKTHPASYYYARYIMID